MRKNSFPTTSRACRRSGLLRMLADTQTGFSIIEVLVASIMVTLMAGAVATALISTATVSGDQRRRSQATEISQQDQERMKGMALKTLQSLDQTRNVGTYDGTAFYVHSTGQFLSTAGSSSCATTGAAAAFVRATTTVNWPANMKGGDINDFSTWAGNSIRPPIKQESLIAPRTGGTLLVKATDQDGLGVGGATVDVIGGKESETADTSIEGCAVLGGLVPGGYFIGIQKPGYVDNNGDAHPYTGATAGSGTASPTPFKYSLAGNVNASFQTTIGGTTYSGQKAPSISWSNPGMDKGPDNFTPTTVPSTPINPSPASMYPFKDPSTGYTNNYTVWAGKCGAALPASNTTTTTVAPVATATPVVKEPGLVIKVSYPTAGTYVTPEHITLTDSCNQTWSPTPADIRPTTDSLFATLGALDFPGQPYGTYSVCADYDPPGTVTRRKLTVTNVANTSMTAANPANVVLTSSTGDGTTC
jgi:Tfp pilus assembly protein PilV